jgi:HPt (histidine-containing phosphotransfer) domain-containing protein
MPVREIPEPVLTALDGLRALGGDDLVRQMVTVFVEYSAGRIRALQGAADSGDLTGVAEAAHALKGSSRQLGLNAMADACLAAEQAAKQGDLAAVQTQAAAVHETYTTAAEWLKAATA